MAEPVKFPKEAKHPFSPHPDVIKLLEDTLALAKEGRVQAVGLACVYRDELEPAGETYSTWAMGSGTKYGLTHAIVALKAKWTREILNETDGS